MASAIDQNHHFNIMVTHLSFGFINRFETQHSRKQTKKIISVEKTALCYYSLVNCFSASAAKITAFSATY